MTKKPINKVLAESLVYYMQQKGFLSQKALADRCGLSQTAISNYLNPNQRQTSKSGKEPSAKLTEVMRLADALSVEIWELLRDATPEKRRFYAEIERSYRKLTERQPIKTNT